MFSVTHWSSIVTDQMFVRHDEAMALIAATTDPRMKAALEYAATTVLAHRGMDPKIVPAVAFDLRFYLEAVKVMFEGESTIRAIVDGTHDSLRWW